MNRYLLYLVLLNMMANTIIFVPKLLIKYRFEGAVISVLIAIPIGLGLTFCFLTVISKFPEQGLPEILEMLVNPKIKTIILIGLGFIWFSAGILTLFGFIDIVNRFINPEISKLYILFLFLAIIFFIIQLPTQKVMYVLEIILFLNVPLIIVIIMKALSSNYLSWDSIWEVGTHLFTKPSLRSLAAASYCFSGYINLLIFNRTIKNKIKAGNLLFIFILGVLNLFTTLFIPIGILGSNGSEEYLYPWITTADSLRMEYGPIERVIFLFLMFYTSIAILSISIHWHVAYEFVKGVRSKPAGIKMKGFIFALFAGISMIAIFQINAIHLVQLSEIWLLPRLVIEIIVVLFMFFVARRQNT